MNEEAVDFLESAATPTQTLPSRSSQLDRVKDETVELPTDNLSRLWRMVRATIAVFIAAGVWLLLHAPGAADLGGAKSMWGALVKDASTGVSLVVRQAALSRNGGAAIPTLLIGIVIAILLAGPVRRVLLVRIARRYSRRYPDTELAIFAPALIATIVTPVAFVVAGLIVGATATASFQLLPAIIAFALLCLPALVVAGLGAGIGQAIRSPADPSLSPLRLPIGTERTINRYPPAAGLMLGFSALIDQFSQLLGASHFSWNVAQGAIVLAEIALIALFLRRLGELRRRLTAQDPDGRVPAVFGGIVLAWIALAIACVAFLLGHVRFAVLALQEMLWAALVMMLAWLITRCMDAAVRRFLDAERRAARFATDVVGVAQARVGQTALVLSAAFSIVVWAIAAIFILAPLHGDGGNVVQQVRPSPLRDTLASIDLSPRTIVTAIAVLVGGVMLTRLSKNWLERRFLPTTHLDIGVRTSVVTGVGYTGVVIALLATTSALGVQLERITLIASALSVGIGFGLQAIIQNFVSGIILLAERPVKIGDRVAVGGSEGRVSRVRVRATELIADDGEIAIVPNSAFISSTVVNKGAAAASKAMALHIKVIGPASASDARDALADALVESGAIDRDGQRKVQLSSLGDGDFTFRTSFSPAEGLSQREATSRILFKLAEAGQETTRFVVN